MAMSNFSLFKSGDQGQGRQSGLKPMCAIVGLGTYTVLNRQMGFEAQNLPLLLCNWSSSADTELPFFLAYISTHSLFTLVMNTLFASMKNGFQVTISKSEVRMTSNLFFPGIK